MPMFLHHGVASAGSKLVLQKSQASTLLSALVLLCLRPLAAGQYCTDWVNCILTAVPSRAGNGSKLALHSGWVTTSLTTSVLLCLQAQAASQYCNDWVPCFLTAVPSRAGSKPALHSS